MTNAICEINTIISLDGKSSSTMTKVLKEFGDGNMAQGIRNVSEKSMRIGFANGYGAGYSNGQTAGSIKGATVASATLVTIVAAICFFMDRKYKKEFAAVRKKSLKEKEELEVLMGKLEEEQLEPQEAVISQKISL